MKVLTKFIIISFLLVLGLSSCKEDKYFDIDRDTWILLKENDTVLFHSVNNTDTFYVSDIETYYEDLDKSYYYQHLNITYKLVHNEVADNSTPHTIFRIHDWVDIYWRRFYSDFSYSSKNPINYTIESKSFDTVYALNNKMEFNQDTCVRTVYYTDKYGIIAYELNNGVIYKIDVNCITFDSD